MCVPHLKGKKIVFQATQIKEYLIEQRRNLYRINYFGIRGCAFFNGKARVLPSIGTCYPDQRAMKMATVRPQTQAAGPCCGLLLWKALPQLWVHRPLLCTHQSPSRSHTTPTAETLEFCALRAWVSPFFCIPLPTWTAQLICADLGVAVSRCLHTELGLGCPQLCMRASAWCSVEL